MHMNFASYFHDLSLLTVKKVTKLKARGPYRPKKFLAGICRVAKVFCSLSFSACDRACVLRDHNRLILQAEYSEGAGSTGASVLSQ